MSTEPTAPPGVNATQPSTSILEFLQDRHFLFLELKLLAGAAGIIYVGAHASLRRPPSASPVVKSGKKNGQGSDKDLEEGDDEEEAPISQGLELSDAITFPLMAAAMLIGLYYLIQWLQDPALLNRALRTYISVMSLVSLTTLFAHILEVATSLAFPTWWRGSDGLLRKVSQKARAVIVCDDVGNAMVGRNSDDSVGPLPAFLAFLTPLAVLRRLAWDARSVLTRRWLFRLYVHGVGNNRYGVRLTHVVAIVLSSVTAVVYFWLPSAFLSNLLGYSLCYGSLLLLSPTDYLTGSLVLVGLFFYDIVMVFYTPYMVTVATQLDVPIKLTFQSAHRRSMLGLGDIVLPGMVMAWALRLDLYMHFLRKVKYESAELQIVERDTASGQVTTRTETKHKEVKARYVNVKGRWGDVLWTAGVGAFFSCGPRRQLPVELAAANFRKTYFYAVMAGYVSGLVVTLAMLLVFQQGQPALLYLVPGVLGSLSATALVRGEMGDVWKYTEDGSLDTVDVVVDLDAEGKVMKTVGKAEDGVVDTSRSDSDKKKEDDADAGGGSKCDKRRETEEGRGLVLVTLDVRDLEKD
ncbi:hypothetical protein L249_4708 [Ophiocordyceps polyrhachis-furcata BCC 54312]|uniref:Signal peptide peptidase n=1 Tax=Ophiocordyceps polyrhachis-furcata BCC 54312 TaxID=1330021 RepID=A0A367L2U9_9HYPO|nr:hypothetical protein L249_4708 [Ophiocordyceps polyrhachis-furcata BCC 54312]